VNSEVSEAEKLSERFACTSKRGPSVMTTKSSMASLVSQRTSLTTSFVASRHNDRKLCGLYAQEEAMLRVRRAYCKVTISCCMSCGQRSTFVGRRAHRHAERGRGCAAAGRTDPGGAGSEWLDLGDVQPGKPGWIMPVAPAG
jgi:hypothetical protein